MLELRIRTFDVSLIGSFRQESAVSGVENAPSTENKTREDKNPSSQKLTPLQDGVAITALPQKKTLVTVIRSPHVDKRGREQLESRRYGRIISLQNKHVSNGVRIENVLLGMPAGVGLTIKLK